MAKRRTFRRGGICLQWQKLNIRYSLRYLLTIRRCLVSDLSNFSPDWHFLPPDVWPLYTNMSKQQEDKGLQVDPEGPWRDGEGEGQTKKYLPMSPGLPLIELQPLRAQEPDKRTHENEAVEPVPRGNDVFERVALSQPLKLIYELICLV